MTHENNNNDSDNISDKDNIIVDKYTDQFEVSFRVLGNEIFGMKLTSKSKAKNWAFFGIFTLFALALLFDILTPSIIAALEFLN